MAPRSVDASSADKGWKAPAQGGNGSLPGGPAWGENLSWPPLADVGPSTFSSLRRIARVRIASFCGLRVALENGAGPYCIQAAWFTKRSPAPRDK